MFRPLLVTCLALSFCHLGCGDEGTDEHEGYDDVILEGHVTDETMLGMGNALDAADPITSATRSPGLDTPEEGAALAAETIPTFSWHIGEAGRPARPAHGDPYSGYATYLQFSSTSESHLVEVFTSELTYTPSAEVWDKLAATGESVTLTLIGADFEVDRVIQDGGPYQGTITSLDISP